jgi:hypothetical protein
MAGNALPDVKKNRKRYPEAWLTPLQESGMMIDESREETYFTLLINIYSLNLLQAVI